MLKKSTFGTWYLGTGAIFLNSFLNFLNFFFGFYVYWHGECILFFFFFFFFFSFPLMFVPLG